jgi:two-component system, LytTR family, response regulator
MADTLIRTIIIDDEPLGRDGVRILLARDAAFAVIGECASGSEAIKAIRELKPDLIFLDISMPSMNGFEMLKAIPKDIVPLVVFVTAHDKYAIPAFEVHALDYLLKPLNAKRFAATLERVKTYVAQRRQLEITDRLVSLLDQLQIDTQRGARPSIVSRFAIKNNDTIYFVEVDDIDWIEASDYYATFHCGKQTHLIRETLTNLETQLDPKRFIRIHRSAIVRIDRIKELKRHLDSGYVVILKDGRQLKLSRSYYPALQSLLGKD